MLLREVSEINNFNNINSLFIKDDFEILEKDDTDDFEDDGVTIFKYEEKLPTELEEKTNKYELKSFIYTNANLKRLNKVKVYRINNKNIVLFRGGNPSSNYIKRRVLCILMILIR